MTPKSEIGKLGENLACRHLSGKRYKILERNCRRPWGEIDIVCLAANKILTFVEVKTVVGANTIISPESQVTVAKLGKFKRVAFEYANRFPKLVDENLGFRLDLIAVRIIGDKARIKHYENI